MELKSQKVLLSDMILCLSRVMEWISPALFGHQMRVAYIARNIAMELGMSPEQLSHLTLAGMMHDIGAFSMKEGSHLNGDDIYPYNILKWRRTYAEPGYQLLKNFQPFHKTAELIRHHHVHEEQGKENPAKGSNIPKYGQIISLAEMIDIFINRDSEILGQVPGIHRRLQKVARFVYFPEYVDAFMKLAEREYFWFNIDSSSVNETVIDSLCDLDIELDLNDILDLSKVFSHLIDFRCHFSATHSSGVAGTAEALAKFYGFSGTGCRMIKVAGYLHDIGKLTIPREILNKPSSLTPEEYNVIKKHPFCTYRALNNIKGMEEISSWASFHHERINSLGYPFRHKGTELSLGSRIIAVSDVFTALAENRPYRKGMRRNNVQNILQGMVSDQSLDSGVVTMLMNNYQQIEESRIMEQVDSARLYRKFATLSSG